MAAGGREIVAQDLGDILCRHLAPVGPSGFAKAENITASVGRHGPAVGEAGIDLTLAVIADEPLRGRIEQRGVGRRQLARKRRRGEIERADRGDLHGAPLAKQVAAGERSEEHTSELKSLMRYTYAVFCLKTKTTPPTQKNT